MFTNLVLEFQILDTEIHLANTLRDITATLTSNESPATTELKNLLKITFCFGSIKQLISSNSLTKIKRNQKQSVNKIDQDKTFLQTLHFFV